MSDFQTLNAEVFIYMKNAAKRSILTVAHHAQYIVHSQ